MKTKTFFSLFAVTIMTGTVDLIEGKHANVELTASSGETHSDTLPLWLFPCQVREGSGFWIEKEENSLTIRCGDK